VGTHQNPEQAGQHRRRQTDALEPQGRTDGPAYRQQQPQQQEGRADHSQAGEGVHS